MHNSSLDDGQRINKYLCNIVWSDIFNEVLELSKKKGTLRCKIDKPEQIFFIYLSKVFKCYKL